MILRIKLFDASVVLILMSFAFSVRIPLVGGGTIYSNGFFFVQTILANRYIHR